MRRLLALVLIFAALVTASPAHATSRPSTATTGISRSEILFPTSPI